jgi:RNA polymerase sigma-B factor
VQELQGQIAKISCELTQKLGRSPRPSEVAQHVGLDVESVIEALAADGAWGEMWKFSASAPKCGFEPRRRPTPGGRH